MVPSLGGFGLFPSKVIANIRQTLLPSCFQWTISKPSYKNKRKKNMLFLTIANMDLLGVQEMIYAYPATALPTNIPHQNFQTLTGVRKRSWPRNGHYARMEARSSRYKIMWFWGHTYDHLIIDYHQILFKGVIILLHSTQVQLYHESKSRTRSQMKACTNVVKMPTSLLYKCDSFILD